MEPGPPTRRANHRDRQRTKQDDMHAHPLLMNAFNTVNLAGAVILASVSHARRLGIPQSQWIYPLGGAGTSDASEFWQRPNFYTSPSIERSLHTALDVSETEVAELDLIDIYSCFPIVPKLAATALGLPVLGNNKPLTLLGGLTSFGGAGNNYSMHALTEMTRQLRSGKGKKGLVLCNGGVLSYQHVVVLGTAPRRSGYPVEKVLPEVLGNLKVPELVELAQGQCVVEVRFFSIGRVCRRLLMLDRRTPWSSIATELLCVVISLGV